VVERVDVAGPGGEPAGQRPGATADVQHVDGVAGDLGEE
jgi:hypothetical protein